MPKLTIHNVSFVGARKAREYAQRVLDSYRAGKNKVRTRQKVDQDHTLFFSIMLGNHHPRFRHFIPEPHKIKHVYSLTTTDPRRHNELHVQCTRGRDHFFKLNECFLNFDKRWRTQALSAMQECARLQFEEYYQVVSDDGKREVKCAISGNVLPAGFKNVVVEYRPSVTFEKIVADFEKEKEIKAEYLPTRNILGKGRMSQAIWEIIDKQIEEDWKGFHRRCASYRVISKEEHEKKKIKK